MKGERFVNRMIFYTLLLITPNVIFGMEEELPGIKNPLTVILRNRNDEQVFYNVQFCSQIVPNMFLYKGYISGYYYNNDNYFDGVALNIIKIEEKKETVPTLSDRIKDPIHFNGRFAAECREEDVVGVLADRYSKARNCGSVAGMLLTNRDNSTDQIFVILEEVRMNYICQVAEKTPLLTPRGIFVGGVIVAGIIGCSAIFLSMFSKISH
jgi:hypothetical protein